MRISQRIPSKKHQWVPKVSLLEGGRRKEREPEPGLLLGWKGERHCDHNDFWES